MASILLVGATGHVGRRALARALAEPRIERVIAPTRRPLPAQAKLVNPVVDFAQLPAAAEWWSTDGAICALGTTRAAAGSDEAFRVVDHHYPLAVARQARAAGTPRFVLISAMGADAGSRFLYMRTKGEVEADIEKLGFPSLTLVRPGLIGGEREERRVRERIFQAALAAVGPALPRRFRVSRVETIVDAVLHGALDAPPGRHVVSAENLA